MQTISTQLQFVFEIIIFFSKVTFHFLLTENICRHLNTISYKVIFHKDSIIIEKLFHFFLL